MPASPRPVNADRIEFSASATAPFWARQHTRLFLGNCGFAREAVDTAQAVVSELTANAFTHRLRSPARNWREPG
jgi:anti-sigma regulatory factor (Ser/Thr protein kinase)